MSGCRIAKVIQLYTLPGTGQQPLQVLRHLESSLAPKERAHCREIPPSRIGDRTSA
jgi:hypothetical protein